MISVYFNGLNFIFDLVKSGDRLVLCAPTYLANSMDALINCNHGQEMSEGGLDDLGFRSMIL